MKGCLSVIGTLFCAFIVLSVIAGASSPPGTPASSGAAALSPRPLATSDEVGLKEGLVPSLPWRFTVEDYGAGKIRGKVVNKTGRDLSYVEVDFNIYDRSGAQIDTAMTNTTNLGAGDTWQFEAVSLRCHGRVHYKCVGLTGH